MRIHRVDWYHHIPSHVKEILAVLQSRGHEPYLVGGCVRDLWLGLRPKDFDLVSSATPEEVEKLFPRTEGVGRQFGIMIVVTDGGPVEVARFRADAEYKDGRHPTGVIFSSPEEDARRRDFTINALFYNPTKGELIDFVGGLEDLEKRLIRCVGDPELRFEEDSLRMLRAARFHSQLAEQNFRLCPELMRAIRNRAERISLVSRERITQELGKILQSKQPSVGLFDLVLLGLWIPLFGSPPPPAGIHANFDALGETFSRISGKPAGLPLFFAAAATWYSGWNTESLVLTKESKAALLDIPKLSLRLMRYFELSKAEKKELLNSPNILESITILRLGDAESNILDELDNAEEDRACWEEKGSLNPPLLITGKDLLAAGFQPGPEIKEIMDRVRRAQLNEEIGTKEEALELALRRLN